MSQADIGAGAGGPIDGNDIAVYHVDTDFMLGDEVSVKITNDKADLPVPMSSEPYIWPACLPKDDDDPEFSSNDHPINKKQTVNAMLAGWLDAPPISQAFVDILGSALSEADILK